MVCKFSGKKNAYDRSRQIIQTVQFKITCQTQMVDCSLLRFVQFLRRKRPEMNQITLSKIAVYTKLDTKTETTCLSAYVSTYYPTFKTSQICTILKMEKDRKDIKSH